MFGWLIIEPRTIIRCINCNYSIEFPSTAVLNLTDLVDHKWFFSCDCGNVLTLRDLYNSGAYNIKGPEAVEKLISCKGYLETDSLENSN